MRSHNGHYLPNPLMHLRIAGDSDGAGWRPVFEVLNLPWVDEGTCGAPGGRKPALARMVGMLARRASGDGSEVDDFF